MRGSGEQTGSPFLHVRREAGVPSDHPLRALSPQAFYSEREAAPGTGLGGGSLLPTPPNTSLH